MILWALPILANAVLRLTDGSGATQTISADSVEFPPAQTGLANSFFLYRASISNLQSDSVYTYSISCDGQTLGSPLGALPTFRTAGLGVNFSFLHIADSGTGADVQHQLASLMSQEGARLLLANGDLAYDFGTWPAIESNYFGVYRDLMAQVPFFSSLGNHEYMTDSGAPALAGSVVPVNGVPLRDQGRYYSFDWGPVHFVALDSNDPLTRADSGDTSMLQWLENDLRTTRKFWRVVFFHHPGYATGNHQNEPEAGRVRQNIVPILERYGVQLVFNGHEHNYQRTYPLLAGQPVAADTGGIVYLTAGGGGQGTYLSSPAAWIAQIRSINHYIRSEVGGAKMIVSTVAPDGTVADSITLAPQPRIAGSPVESASYSARLASGGLAAIFGSNLCVSQAQPAPFGADAAGTSVSIDGVPAPILYGDANQINIQIPFASSGACTLEVRTPNGVASLGAAVAPLAPAIFVNPDGSGLAIAQRSDGSLISPDSPAAAGDVVTVFATGLGAVNGTAIAGTPPVAPIPVKARIQCMLGGVSAEVISAALDTGYPGLYRILLRVPSALPTPAPVQFMAGGVASNTALLPVG